MSATSASQPRRRRLAVKLSALSLAISARIVGAGVLSALAIGCASLGSMDASGDCPVCHKPFGDAPEVRVVRPGESGPGTRYRCFMCPIVEGGAGEAWTMRAVSGVDGKWVAFAIDGERVEADPPTAVVLALEVAPGAECLDVHRVFTDEDEFRRYVAEHPDWTGMQPQRLEAVLASRR